MRIQLLSINYAPERTGIAPYSTQLAEHLATQHDVTVITGVPHYPDWRVERNYRRWRRESIIGGVEVVRLGHYVPARPSLAHRAAYEASWASRAYAAGRARRPDVVLAVIPALLSGVVGARLARRAEASFGLIVQDVMRTAAAQVGLRGAGFATHATTAVERSAVRSADGIVTIHPRLAELLRGDARAPVEVIPNWSHVLAPELDTRAFRRRLGWRDNEIVVLHSGNMGLKQNLENVVDAAWAAERDGLKLRFVLAGGGSQEFVLAERAAGCSALSMMGPVSDAEYVQLLASADVLLVNERPGMTEMSLPSKITSYLRAGRPVLAATDLHSVTAASVREFGGALVEAGRPDELASAALALAQDRDRCARITRQQRAYLDAVLSPELALARYADWVDRLAAGRGSTTLFPAAAVHFADAEPDELPPLSGAVDATG